MVSQKVKDIIAKSPVKDLLEIDDENDMIVGNFLRVEMTNEIRGNITFWLFGHAFQTEVFFNDVDAVYLDSVGTQRDTIIDANDLGVKDMTISPELIKFFNIKLRVGIATS